MANRHPHLSLARFLGVGFLVLLCVLGWIFLRDNSNIPGTAVLGIYRERWFLAMLFLSYLAIWLVALSLIKTKKVWLFRIVSIHLGVLTLLVLIEAFALVGIVDFRMTLGETGVGKLFGRYKPDKRLRSVGKPNQVFKGTTYQDLTKILGVKSDPIHFMIQTDRFGLRNPPGNEDPEVLLLGDSILQAGLIPVERTVTEKLEAALGVSVMNISEPAYCPQEELIRLETTGIDVQGKIVIQFIFEGNDLGGSRTWRMWRQRRFQSEWPYSGLMKNLVGFLHEPKHVLSDSLFGLFTDSSGQETRVYFFYDSVTIASQMNEMPYLKAEFSEAKNKIESSGGIYAIAFVPTKLTVLHRFCKWPKGSRFELSAAGESIFCKALGEFCSREKIPFIDLREPLMQQAKNGSLPYFPVDTHLNSLGHEAIALFLAPWVNRSKTSI